MECAVSRWSNWVKVFKMNTHPTSHCRKLSVESNDPGEHEVRNSMLRVMAKMFPDQRAKELAAAQAGIARLSKRWVEAR